MLTYFQSHPPLAALLFLMLSSWAVVVIHHGQPELPVAKITPFFRISVWTWLIYLCGGWNGSWGAWILGGLYALVILVALMGRVANGKGNYDGFSASYSLVATLAVYYQMGIFF